jgi:hypothetical protein
VALWALAHYSVHLHNLMNKPVAFHMTRYYASSHFLVAVELRHETGLQQAEMPSGA